MAEFYDPMLYMSTPERPNTMGVVVGLKEKVDGNVLRNVVESLRVRFPYFYVKAAPQGNDLLPEEDASFLVSLAPTAVGSNLAEGPDEHVVSGPYPYRYIAM